MHVHDHFNFLKMSIPEAKVVLLGSQGVGKTSFINRYVGNIFEERTSPTIGASFFTCQITVDDHQIKLLIWDTAGQERFRSMAPMYYRNANAAILMYDITSQDSYESMKNWVKELKTRLEQPVIMCVVGNKFDQYSLRQISFKEATEYAISIGALYHECSALNCEGVETVFLDIAQELIKEHNRMKDNKNGLKRFQGGSIIKVNSLENSSTENNEDERSYICC